MCVDQYSTIARPTPATPAASPDNGMIPRRCVSIIVLILLMTIGLVHASEPPAETGNGYAGESAGSLPATAVLPASLGITFVDGSNSTIVIEKDGRTFLVNLVSREIDEVTKLPGSATESSSLQAAARNDSPVQVAAAKLPSQGQKLTGASSSAEPEPEVYLAGDDYIFSLPTGRRLDRRGLYVNFNHRFVFDPFFTGKSKGHTLGGLDGVAVASFGFRYGITEKLSAAIYRSPSLMGRPIQLTAGYDFLSEKDKYPLNASFRSSVEGRNSFTRDFTLNFEWILSRSLTKRAQVYVVPTVSLWNRPLVIGDLYAPPPDLPPIHSFSIGVGAAVDVRPTVALVAEVMPTVVNAREMGIHRPAFAFGIQKKVHRHAFTIGFSNSPGSTTSQRAGTRATFLRTPSADTPSGMFISFDLSRQLF